MRKSILDVGCGKHKYPNAIGIDIDKNSDADVIHDLNKVPYPFPKNKFDLIIMDHILEHLPNTLEVMNEIYRIAKPNAKVIIKVPHFSSVVAWENPDHKKAFALRTFHTFHNEYFYQKNIPRFDVCKQRLNYLIFGRKEKGIFHGIKILLNKFLSFFANLSPRFCERVWCYWVGGFGEIEVELNVVK